mmetsp:Transcript_21162/g.37483  ORF Transcript_21162/g.37483 Transcript_21162/m.37483 type:complete len:92 (-) Transcript_21162:110-385(-)
MMDPNLLNSFSGAASEAVLSRKDPCFPHATIPSLLVSGESGDDKSVLRPLSMPTVFQVSNSSSHQYQPFQTHPNSRTPFSLCRVGTQLSQG